MSLEPLHTFQYDDFQKEAIAEIDKGHSLFVAAPTGSGKTVLADYVIDTALKDRQRVIYTAPIKALSNQKFRDFSLRYPDKVGIMTGDVTMNPSAPLIIMTTEIYRNTLLEDIERFSQYTWIIFDEIHYLDDADRGTVWEESILFTPPNINLLCLSATIPNVEEIAQWIRNIHDRKVSVVVSNYRPVPLQFHFQCQNKIYDTLEDLKKKGYRDQRHFHTVKYRRGHRPRIQLRTNRIDTLVEHLREENQLPGILFTFGRRRAEDLAWQLSGLSLVNEAESAELLKLFDHWCVRFQVTDDPTMEMLRRLVQHGLAYHHAGMLPTAKEVIERCFSSRLVKLIVTTETFAMGINMPARSVILDTLKKRSGGGFALLSRRSFMQMSGRAGRRGMDDEGSVYLRVNPRHVDHTEVTRLLQKNPEGVHSRFNMTYATLLNLYRRHQEGVFDLFPQTLYYYQNTGPMRAAGLQAIKRKIKLLNLLDYIVPEGLTEKGEFASWLYGYELLLTELNQAEILKSLKPMELAILVLAMIYEPRPGLPPYRRNRFIKRLEQFSYDPLTQIHRTENRLLIKPKTKVPYFHLTEALQAWMQQTDFHQLSRYTAADEGEIVRYFRMCVQLLRQLAESPAADETLRDTAGKAFRKINRDVIDAEAQLRMSAEE